MVLRTGLSLLVITCHYLNSEDSYSTAVESVVEHYYFVTARVLPATAGYVR